MAWDQILEKAKARVANSTLDWAKKRTAEDWARAHAAARQVVAEHGLEITPGPDVPPSFSTNSNEWEFAIATPNEPLVTIRIMIVRRKIIDGAWEQGHYYGAHGLCGRFAVPIYRLLNNVIEPMPRSDWHITSELELAVYVADSVCRMVDSFKKTIRPSGS